MSSNSVIPTPAYVRTGMTITDKLRIEKSYLAISIRQAFTGWD